MSNTILNKISYTSKTSIICRTLCVYYKIKRQKMSRWSIYIKHLVVLNITYYAAFKEIGFLF